MLWIWIGFIIFVLFLLALDLGVLNRKAHVVGVKEALGWSALWIALGLAFSIFVYFGYQHQWMGLGTVPDAADGGQINNGAEAVIKYLTGYIVEKSLSVDNIFVIAVIFNFFAVPAIYQHRVLFWGILGALIMRGLMVGIGAKLIADFHWILYVFGAFLIFTAIKMLLVNSHSDPSANPVVKLVKKFFPVTSNFHGQHFLVKAGSKQSHEAAVAGEAEQADAAVNAAVPGTWMITPLALALITVELTDVVFAVDSIPAIFAITADPFLVFTSNVFAMLGLRSLYFALGGMMSKFRFLKVSLAVILAVVGAKMMAHAPLKAWLGDHFNFYLLGVVLLILLAGVVASILRPAPGVREPATV
jgi:tellurite resistance protein TerC